MSSPHHLTPESVRFCEGKSYVSLEKLIGKHIKDIECCLSSEYGQVNVVLHAIHFEDGTYLECEGEHDFPWLADPTGDIFPPEEALQTLEKELWETR